MKFMNLKRFASTALAGVMALSMAVPALAASNSTVITGTYESVTLSVVVPTTGKAIINPYGLPYKLSADYSVSGQAITTAAPLVIQNKSVVPLTVTADITATTTTGVTMDATGDTASYDSATGKNILVNFQAFEALGITGDNVTDNDTLLPKFVALEDSDAVLTAELTTASAGVSTSGTLVLREGNADGELQSGGAAFFRLSGQAAKKAAWTATDGFTATIAFTFEPSATAYSKSAGTIAGAGGAATTSDGGTLDLTLTPNLPAGVTVSTWAWSSADPSEATVVAKSDTKEATVTDVTNGTAGTVKITVSGTGSDGLPYVATFDFTTKAS